MDVRSDIFSDTPDGFHLRDVSVRLARPDERIRRDRLMDQHHYLGFKRFAGRGLQYVFEWRGQWVDLAGWQSGCQSAFNGDPLSSSNCDPLQEGDRWGGAAAGPACGDDPSQSFLCRSSLVAFPSLPDEKEFR